MTASSSSLSPGLGAEAPGEPFKDFRMPALGLQAVARPQARLRQGRQRCETRRFADEAPHEGADRRRLRPAYKRAYRACLRLHWEHVKAKGWADRCVLYISEEPYDRLLHIREQMKALSAMIHEGDPAIPIYASTWHHQGAWDGSLDVWGIGHFGTVAPEKMAALRHRGAVQR